MKKRMNRADLLLITGLLLAGLLGAFFIFFQKAPGGVVRVTVDGETYGVYALCDARTIPIQRKGVTINTLVIRDGRADMTDADCPDKLCVRQKAIAKQGETIVCLPNRVVVTVERAQDGALDAVAN